MDNHLLNKSQQNKIALAHLKKVGIFAPCIHCSYYSCLQKAMGILMDYENDIYMGAHRVEGKRGNTHGYYIREFSNVVRRTFRDREGAKIISEDLFKLKQFREDSDYGNIEIIESKVEEVERMMNNFHRIVKRHMKL